MEGKLKLNSKDAILAPPMAAIKEDISKAYDSVNELFGNIDISNLNENLASLLKSIETEELQGAGERKDTVASINLHAIKRGYPKHWATTNNKWQGRYYESALGDLRQVAGYLHADERIVGAISDLKYPHAFLTCPYVYITPILPPIPKMISNITKYNFSNISYEYSGLGDQSVTDTLRIIESGVRDAHPIVRELLIVAVGVGKFDVGPAEYERPDFHGA